MGLLKDMLVREYGISSTYHESPPGEIVGVAVSELRPNNPDRIALTVVNYGAGWLIIGFDNEISATRGIYLPSGGGTVNLKWRDEQELIGARVWAIAQNAATPVYFMEVIALTEE